MSLMNYNKHDEYLFQFMELAGSDQNDFSISWHLFYI